LRPVLIPDDRRENYQVFCLSQREL
jgi:hypothetical protein